MIELSEKVEECPWGWFDISRPATSTAGPQGIGSRVKEVSSSVPEGGATFFGQWARQLPKRVWKWGCYSGGSEDNTLWQKELFGIFKILQNSPCYILDILGSCDPFFPSNCSLLEWECLLCARTTTVIWKQLPCLASQVHSWHRILPEDES